MKIRYVLSLVLFTLTFAFAGIAHSATKFSEQQKQEIEKIVHQYLVKNPEVLVEAAQELEQKQRKEMAQRAKVAIAKNAKALFKAPGSPVAGNSKGNANIVEFFDYQCIHCKKMAPVVKNLRRGDKQLRVVYKELPIFGADSTFAAKAALAARKQKKYLTFHDALMKSQGKLTNKAVMDIAKAVGLNTNKLRKDMRSKAIKAELDANMLLARELGIMGTPAFVIASNPAEKNKETYFVPGGTTQAMLEGLIKKVR